MIMRNYKTSKGTELPLLNLRGKQYLEVKFRLVWFREDHPDWSIETELISVTDVSAYARATIKDETGRIIATSHKFESIQGFPDFIEKAETGAIGRALALIGYGTQFCADELDEGKRIVDAPVTPKTRTDHLEMLKSTSSPSEENEEAIEDDDQRLESHFDEDQDVEEEVSDPGEYRINFGRKYKGKRLKDIPKKEVEGYLKWLDSNAIREGTPLSHQVRSLKTAFSRLNEVTEKAASH